MNWFLVLLFWNPAIQNFTVADGWAPLSMPSQAVCEMKLDFVDMYIPAYVPDNEHELYCVQADNVYDAITKAMNKE